MDYGPAPEDAGPARAWLAQYAGRFGHYIGGAWTPPSEGVYFDSTDPATGEKLAAVALGSPADVDAAVRAARAALPAWQALTGHGRARHLYALARLVQKHARRLAVLETLDNGKPIRESRDIDVPLVARHFYHHAGWAQLLDREFPGQVPCGVAAQIIPWNFPLLMLAWKVAPALAAANTVVLKPAEFTPLTALAFAQLCEEAGLPPGVLNIVTGDGSTGAALVKHPGTDKIAFTGSTEVGREIRRASAGSHQKLSLELGGKSPFVVFEDADLDSAVEGLVDGIWLNQGQVCCAGSRLLVQESVAQRLLEKVRARMGSLRIGSPLDKTTDIGAIVAPVQLQRIRELVQQGIAEGATCWQPPLTLPQQGLYFAPTLLTGVQPSAMVAQREIFGPVLTTLTFRTPDEAVELANNTVYGLAASVWSESIGQALDIATGIKAGVVWVNGTNMFDAACGFGGYRESGFGREGGREGMREYLQPAWWRKAVAIGAAGAPAAAQRVADDAVPASSPGEAIDRTVKLFIGGRQVRPDSGYSLPCLDAAGRLLGEVPAGNRKDIRNAVEAARAATGWARMNGHQRAQVLYYIAENMQQRRTDIGARLAQAVGRAQARRELRLSIERLFSYAAWADKFDGAVHDSPVRTLVLAVREPIGVAGVICPSPAPLLGMVSMLLPLIALGNAVVAVPSRDYPLIAADLYQVLETSDLPAGVVNLVTGDAAELMRVLAAHDEVQALWCYGDEALCAEAKRLSAGNLKRTWSNEGRRIDFFRADQGEGRWYLEQACQVKNIWLPYGA
ncbi:MAG: aldehyde dehydrogenase family protein [Proteobacteria bacterium]|nr:aldehyde dehydrogenase family protein [Pseudomonadota bacterium]